jgi:hypothetical protein
MREVIKVCLLESHLVSYLMDYLQHCLRVVPISNRAWRFVSVITLETVTQTERCASLRVEVDVRIKLERIENCEKATQEYPHI